MAFNRPTLPELIDRVAADFEARLPGTDARLRRSNVAVIARVLAGGLHTLYGYIDWIAKQVIPDTAETEHLERWTAVYGLDRTPAAFATGSVTFTGTTGLVVPKGTQVQRSDGTLYTTDADGTLASGTVTIAVTALLAGAAGNAATAAALTMTSPIAGINSAATVASPGLTGGADAETDTSLRARLLQRLREPPMGGAASDYKAWADAAHADVTRVWVAPEELGPGTVTVRLVTDDVAGGPIPSPAVLTAVTNYIEARRPVTADVYVLAPVAVPLNFTIALSPNTTAVRTAVEAELKDMLRRDAEPGGTIYVSRIREAISVAAGETSHSLTTPAANVTHTTGQLATFGTITWS